MRRIIYMVGLSAIIYMVGCAGMANPDGMPGRYEHHGPVVLIIEGASEDQVWEVTVKTLVGMSFPLAEKDYQANVLQTAYARAPEAALVSGATRARRDQLLAEAGVGRHARSRPTARK